MPKIQQWTAEQASKELSKRLKYAKEQKSKLEKEWDSNESVVMNVSGEANLITWFLCTSLL